MKFSVSSDIGSRTAAVIADRSDKAKHILAQQVRKDTSPYVPFLNGSLDQRTRVIGNTVVYPGPYARYLYYGVKMVDAATGKGPMRFTDKLGNVYIRYRKGATLRPTNTPLKYTKQHHSLAGAKWFARSKARNISKWEQVYKKAITNG